MCKHLKPIAEPRITAMNCLITNCVESFMHWLHVNPNSDFSTFRHFFGRILFRFLQIFGRYFAKKILETLAFVIFSEDNLHLADFQHFLAKFRHIFGKKEEFGRLLEFGFCLSSEFWDKFWRKT